MTDNRSAEKRRATMQAVKGKDTAPELIVRRFLHRLGYRFRLHGRGLPGRPDLVFPSRRKAIFIHGCFWHAHGCRIGKAPKSRLDYWLPKLERNRERDAEKAAQLDALGWTVLTVWQCETRDLEALACQLRAFLGPPGKSRSTSRAESNRLPPDVEETTKATP